MLGISPKSEKKRINGGGILFRYLFSILKNSDLLALFFVGLVPNVRGHKNIQNLFRDPPTEPRSTIAKNKSLEYHARRYALI